MIVSSRFDHNPDHIHIPRVRQDRAWVDLEQSPPPFTGWRWDIITAAILIIIGTGVFPALELIVAVIGH